MTRAWCRAVVVVIALWGCGGPELRGRLQGVDALIATARDSGAVRCAPVELAMAESHADFARQELSEGRYYQARTELGLAETSAREAVRRSPRNLCVGPPDSDSDGVADATDACPDQAEDKDGFEDADGCPDTDNDADGVLDAQDSCPDSAEDPDGFRDGDGCPEPDNDQDGILDAEDACPGEAEDKDGFQDGDGCPDADNDGDGLLDAADGCPGEPEDKDGHQDEDGCPDCDDDGDGVPECPQLVDLCPEKPAATPDGCPPYKLVVVTQAKIEIKQTIFFEYKKAIIKNVSYGLLDEVALVLRDNPRIRVRIEGHTDDRGSDVFNLGLSQQRADAVREFLISRGIEAARMEAKGFGETMSIASNRTEPGRAQNRRVEFVITER